MRRPLEVAFVSRSFRDVTADPSNDRVPIRILECARRELIGDSLALGSTEDRLDTDGSLLECIVDCRFNGRTVALVEELHGVHLCDGVIVIARDIAHTLIPPAEVTVSVENVDQVGNSIEYVGSNRSLPVETLLAGLYRRH